MAKQFNQSSIEQASLPRRLAALVYDGMILTAVLFGVGAAGVALNHGEAVSGPLFESALFIAVFLFNAYFWTRSGQTLGMMAWRLRVQTVEGYSLSWMHSLKRFLVAIISLALGGMGYWWMLLNDEKLTWHDMASNTRVVRLPPAKKR